MAEESISAVNSGDELLRVVDLQWVVGNDFTHQNVVILVHGFTANGKYLVKLGSFLNNNGFQALLFNYNSYRGISKAADSLADYLIRYENQTSGLISKNRVYLIAHSMGGLVARGVVMNAKVKSMIRGIVMLGTPNGGCFSHKKWLASLIEYGEYLSAVMPPASTPACKSAIELTKADLPTPFLSLLNNYWENSSNCPPTISISGGRKYLEISKNNLRNFLANRALQRMMQGQENDGLVLENSVNLNSSVRIGPTHQYTHFNNYPYYPDLNHSYLKDNQSLALEIIQWLRGLP